MPTDVDQRPPTPTQARTSSLRDAAIRLGLWWTALGLALVLPAWAAAPLTAVSAAVVLERLVRHRLRGSLDAALVAAAGAVLAPIGLGLLLNLLPVGLTRASWTVGLALVGAVALGLAARSPLPPSQFRRWIRQIQPISWVFAAGAAIVVVVAVGLSARVTDQVDTAPLQLSASAVTDGHTTVTISSGQLAEGLSLVRVSDGSSQVVARNIVVSAGRDQSIQVTIANDQRSTLDLLDSNQTVIRELILDVSPTVRSTS